MNRVDSVNWEQFWNIIAESRHGFDSRRLQASQRNQVTQLKRLLDALPADEQADFGRRYTELFYKAYRYDLWAALYVIIGGGGDDSFMDFREWLISMGRDVYHSALNDPDSLAFIEEAEDCIFEGFGNVIPHHEPATPRPAHPTGEEWEDEDLPRLLPKLWAKYVDR